jgi:cytochrome b pre-mRNA-processing protein 3
MLNVLTKGKQRRDAAGRIYAAAATRAREPVFFERFAVPDTLDGRFDLLTLHVWLVLDRLKGEPALSQSVVDTVFVGFDEALRQMGAGDIGMGRRMKKFADAFYGRLKAYDEASGAAAMEAALIRNLYRGTPAPCAAPMAAYVLSARQYLAAWENGTLDFGPLPGSQEGSHVR